MTGESWYGNSYLRICKSRCSVFPWCPFSPPSPFFPFMLFFHSHPFSFKNQNWGWGHNQDERVLLPFQLRPFPACLTPHHLSCFSSNCHSFVYMIWFKLSQSSRYTTNKESKVCSSTVGCNLKEQENTQYKTFFCVWTWGEIPSNYWAEIIPILHLQFSLIGKNKFYLLQFSHRQI